MAQILAQIFIARRQVSSLKSPFQTCLEKAPKESPRGAQGEQRSKKASQLEELSGWLA